MKRFAAILALFLAGAAPMRVADPVKLLGWMSGKWMCTSTMSGHTEQYNAAFAYTADGTWLRENDTWPGGGDETLFTYVTAQHRWASVVTASDRTVTVFSAPDTGLAHIAYRSVYPDATTRVIFDRISMTKYTLHFTEKTPAGVRTGTDVCRKQT